MTRFTNLSKTGKALAAKAKSAVAVRDNNSGLIWATKSIKVSSHAEAEKAAAALDLMGHKGWRLPTVEELFLLADRTRRSPAIDTDFFPDTKNDWYWSSSPYAGSSGYAWGVGFLDGDGYFRNRGNDGFVRAVRGPVSASQ